MAYSSGHTGHPSRRSMILGGAAIGATAVTALSSCTEAPAEGGRTAASSGRGQRGYVMEEEVATGKAPLTRLGRVRGIRRRHRHGVPGCPPDVKIDVEIVAKVDAGERMALDGEAGSGADVFTLQYDQLSSAIDAGTAAPIGQYEDALTERSGPVFAAAVSREGAMHGVPIATESIALFYNRTS